jgi:very-short-patch-repair endonuclease
MLDGGLPAPVLQHEVVDANGRRWRLDFAWPERRVALEYDGVAWHSGAEAFFRDRRRYATLQELGWVVVSIVAEDVRCRPSEIVRRVETQLDRASAA